MERWNTNHHVNGLGGVLVSKLESMHNVSDWNMDSLQRGPKSASVVHASKYVFYFLCIFRKHKECTSSYSYTPSLLLLCVIVSLLALLPFFQSHVTLKQDSPTSGPLSDIGYYGPGFSVLGKSMSARPKDKRKGRCCLCSLTFFSSHPPSFYFLSAFVSSWIWDTVFHN